MSVPAAREKYSPLIMPYPVGSPKLVFCLATAPGTSILTGVSRWPVEQITAVGHFM
jgi:hypothetical protein